MPCDSRSSTFYVPVPVLWELSLLARVGKIDLAKPLGHWCQDLFRRPTFATVFLDVEHVVEAHALRFTTDPFDLLIVAVARTLGYPLITKDAAIEAANLLPTLW